MFRSLMTITRELYLYLTKVIFMLKHSVKLRPYINLVMWQHVCLLSVPDCVFQFVPPCQRYFEENRPNLLL